MELPITKPVKVSYADQVDFQQLLEDLCNDKKTCFLRVTSGSEEGYLLLKDGEKVAASYESQSRVEAIKKIEKSVEEANTLIEVFEIKPTQINYLIDINKHHLIESEPSAQDLIDELKKSTNKTVPEKKIVTVPKEKPIITPPKEKIPTQSDNINDKYRKESEEIISSKTDKQEEKSPSKSNKIAEHPRTEDLTHSITRKKVMETIPIIENEIKEPEKKLEQEKKQLNTSDEKVKPEAILDRSAIMKKYGIKDADTQDIEKILSSYTGGYITDDDVEKVELTLMNRIKKSILGLPKIKGVEVMVFLDNSINLQGNINIISEFQGGGFISRIMGEAKAMENLERQIKGIAEIEIKRVFREYPEILDKFDIKVEIA